MSAARKADSDLDRLIDEIIVDAYDEDEQLMGFEVAFDEGADFPCPGTVVGEEVVVVSVSVKNHRRELVATCIAAEGSTTWHSSTLMFAATQPRLG